MHEDREKQPGVFGELVEIPHSQPVPLDTLRDNEKRRREFAIRVIELADDFDTFDHEFGPMGGTALQDDCQAVRDFVRSISGRDS